MLIFLKNVLLFFSFILFFLLYLLACLHFFFHNFLMGFYLLLNEHVIHMYSSANKKNWPKTWSLRFDILMINVCIWDYKPGRLVLRCWCLTPINHKVACGDDLEIFIMMSKFHRKRIWEVIRWNIVMFPKSVWAINFSSDWCMICLP